MDNTEKFPSQLRHRADAVIGAAFSPPPEGNHLNGDAAGDSSSSSSGAAGGQLLLRSHGFLCLVDLAAPLPTHARIHPQTHLAARNDLARRTRVKQQRANHLKYLARMPANQEAAAAAAGAASTGDGVGAANDNGLSLSAAALSHTFSALKRQRSNSTSSITSNTSASEFITSGSGSTPARRLRSDSVTSAGSDHLGGNTPVLGRIGAAGYANGKGGDDDDDEEEEDDLNNDLNRNFAITLKYRPVLFADYLGPGELLVVEEPWLKIMQRLPDPLFRQRFGT